MVLNRSLFANFWRRYCLYITDVSTRSELLPIPIPIDGLSNNSGGGLSWSLDGRKILVRYSDDKGSALYQIDVTPTYSLNVRSNEPGKFASGFKLSYYHPITPQARFVWVDQPDNSIV